MENSNPRSLKNKTNMSDSCKTLGKSFRLLMICVLVLSPSPSLSATCPSSVSSSFAITSEIGGFSGYSAVILVSVARGQVSNSLYLMYSFYTYTQTTSIRKISSSGTQSWIFAIPLNPGIKSLAVDSLEQNVYFISGYGNIFSIVTRINTNTGSIVDSQNHLMLTTTSNEVRIQVLSDNSGYYIFGNDASSNSQICKYLHSSSTSQCRAILNLRLVIGQIMISDTQIFTIGYDSSTGYYGQYINEFPPKIKLH